MMVGLIPLSLIFTFFLTAVLYASVGFGGGSTYAALLVFFDLDYRIIPILVLCCNVVVVAGNTMRFTTAGLAPWKAAITITLFAAPAAFLGGITPIGERSFYLVLGCSLILTALSMLIPARNQSSITPSRSAKYVSIIAIPLGYLAGLVGIGGGIFLAPLLHLTRWSTSIKIAATSSIFILINSIFGLFGQLAKGGVLLLNAAVSGGFVLLVTVAVGGQIGSLISIRFLPQKVIRWTTAFLVFIVGFRLLFYK